MADETSTPAQQTSTAPPQTQVVSGYKLQQNASGGWELVNPGYISGSPDLINFFNSAYQAGTRGLYDIAYGAGMISGSYTPMQAANQLLSAGINPLSSVLTSAAAAALKAYSNLGSSAQASGGGTGSYTSASQAFWSNPANTPEGREQAAIGNALPGTSFTPAQSAANPSLPINQYGGAGYATYGPAPAAAASNGLLTAYVPVGNYRQMEIQNAKIAVNPISGEYGVYQQLPGNRMAANPVTGKLENFILVGGGGVGAATSGTVSLSALTPAVMNQETGNYITPKYAAYDKSVGVGEILSAIQRGNAQNELSRLGAEAYGGIVSKLDARTLGDIKYESYKYPAAQSNLSDITYRPGVNFAQNYLSDIPWSVGSETTNLMALGPQGVSNLGNITQVGAQQSSTYNIESFYAGKPTKPLTYIESNTQEKDIDSGAKMIGGLMFTPLSAGRSLGVPTSDVPPFENPSTSPSIHSSMLTAGLGEWGAKYLKSNQAAYEYGQTQGPVVAFGTGVANIFTSIPGQVTTATYAIERSLRSPSEFGPSFTASASAIPGLMYNEATTNPIGFAGGIVGGLLLGKAMSGSSLSAAERVPGYTYASSIDTASGAIKSFGSSAASEAASIASGVERGGLKAFGNDYGMINPPKTPITTFDLTNAPLPPQPRGMPTIDLTAAPAPEFGIYRSPAQAAQLSIDINRGLGSTAPSVIQPTVLPTFDLTAASAPEFGIYRSPKQAAQLSIDINRRSTGSDVSAPQQSALPTFDLTTASAPEFGIYRSPKQAAQLSIDINRGMGGKASAVSEPSVLSKFDLTNAPAPEFGAYRTPQDILGNVIRSPASEVTGAPIQSPSGGFGAMQTVEPIMPSAKTTVFDLTNAPAPELPKANAPRYTPPAGEVDMGNGLILRTMQEQVAPEIKTLDLRQTIDLTNVEAPLMERARIYTPVTTVDLTNAIVRPAKEAGKSTIETIDLTAAFPESEVKQAKYLDIGSNEKVAREPIVSDISAKSVMTTESVLLDAFAPTTAVTTFSSTASSSATGSVSGSISGSVGTATFAPVTEAVTPIAPFAPIIPPFWFPSFGGTTSPGAGGKKMRYGKFREALVGVKFNLKKGNIAFGGFAEPKKGKKAAAPKANKKAPSMKAPSFKLKKGKNPFK